MKLVEDGVPVMKTERQAAGVYPPAMSNPDPT